MVFQSVESSEEDLETDDNSSLEDISVIHDGSELSLEEELQFEDDDITLVDEESDGSNTQVPGPSWATR